MATGVVFEIPGGTQQDYEEMSRKMFGGQLNPSEPIQGLIIHTAGASKTGWRIFDVWESKGDFDRFMEQTVMPAMGDRPQGPEPEIYELANVVPGKVGATA